MTTTCMISARPSLASSGWYLILWRRSERIGARSRKRTGVRTIQRSHRDLDKWTSTALELRDLRISKAEKFRWVRKFEIVDGKVVEIPLGADKQPIGDRPSPDQGCNVEFTELTLDGSDVCHTLGFEAFGPLDSVESSLRLVAAAFASRNPPMPEGGKLASYPGWLSACH